MSLVSLSVYSILHARLHSSQPVCQHRNTGQLSEYSPADSGILLPTTTLYHLINISSSIYSSSSFLLFCFLSPINY